MDDGLPNSQEIQPALDQLAEALAGSTFRAALRNDPEGAATNAGITVDVLPDGLLTTLGLMSDEELQIVARVQLTFAESLPGRVCIIF
jgi:hypothetical protein